MTPTISRRSLLSGGAAALALGALTGCSQNNDGAGSSGASTAPAAKPVILVTSFGTSYNSTRHVTIGAIEDAIREKYGRDYDVRRAFTSQIIIDKLKERDGIEIDNVEEALDRAKADGVETVIVQPTHLMAGLEYTDIKDELDKRSDDFKQVALGEPLLASDADYQAVAEAIAEQRANLDDGTCAFVLMGHGTTADSNADYATMQLSLIHI